MILNNLQKYGLSLLLPITLNGCTWIENDLDKGLAYGRESETLTRKIDEGHGKRYKQKGVNAYLWRAAMDMVGHWPLLTANPQKGLIETDWQSAPTNPDERTKFLIEVLDTNLRPDTVRVSVAREVRQGSAGRWTTAPTAAATAQTMEDMIILNARALR
jgi:hypothetical protein